MRILITGATGLIGKELGKRLVAAGHTVTAVSRSVKRARRELPFPARLVGWQGPSEPFPAAAALEGVEAVIHLMGESIADGRWTAERKRSIRDSRVLSTRALVEAIAQAPSRPRVLVQGSAMGIYGDRGDELLTETSEGGQGFLADVVRDWESEAAAVEAHGVRLAVVRTGIVLSPHGGALEKMIPLFAKGVGGQLGSGQQWMSWIHLDDVVGIFAAAASDESFRGFYNGVAPEPARNDRFSQTLCRVLGRPMFLPVPRFALKLALGEAADAVLASSRVLPARLQERSFIFQHPTLEGALKDCASRYRGGWHELLHEQWVRQTPDEVFPFFCDERNLETLTPSFLGFRVLGKSTPAIAEGTLINYRLSLHGVPVTWQSKIEDWQPGVKFLDRQLKGPYREWIHTHEFVPTAGGTLLRDRVAYKLPLGWLGEVAAGWRVQRDVSEIFRFRREKIAEIFGVDEA